ncbi:MAG: hypothetical protein SFZ02_20630 [bacterium]|nr:hypothetical protein [bacterium]
MMLRRLTLWHITVLLALPILLALINPNWLFNLSFSHDFIIMVDDYIYTGYQMALPQYVGWYPSDTMYFIERISWILPGYIVRQIASPLVAQLIIHFVLYYMAIFSVYGILNKLANRRVALIIAVLFGQYPLIMRSLGWNYVDGYAMTCMAVCILLLTYAGESRWRPVYLVGAGGALMLMVIANTFNGFYVLAIALYFLALDKTYQKPLRLILTGIYALVGVGLVYGGLALFYYDLTGNILLTNTLKTSQQFSLGANYFLSYHYSGIPAYWHVFLLIVAILALWGLIWRTRRLSPETRRGMQAIVVLFVGAYGVIVGWLLAGFLYSQAAFYHANVIMVAFLVLGMLVYKPITDLSPANFRLAALMAFIVPMLPFALFTLSPASFNFDGLVVWLIIGAIGCGLIIMLMRHPFRNSMATILLCTFCGVMIGNSVSIQTYVADRYRDQRVYEDSTAIAQAINARYATLSLDKFRLWYDFSDPKLPTFHAVASLYLWSLGRNARLNEAPPENTFFQADEIIILSSLHDKDTLVQMANTTLQNKAIITVVDEQVVGDIRLVFLNVSLSLFGRDSLNYYFSDTQQQYVLEENGWNGYEQVPQNSRPFRWTAEPTARLVLDVGEATFDPQQAYRVSFVIAGSLEDEVVNSLSLRINGQAVTLTRENNSYSGVVTGALLTLPTLELIFETDRVSNPFDLGIQDGRKLGVAIGELIIAPITNEE